MSMAPHGLHQLPDLYSPPRIRIPSPSAVSRPQNQQDNATSRQPQSTGRDSTAPRTTGTSSRPWPAHISPPQQPRPA